MPGQPSLADLLGAGNVTATSSPGDISNPNVQSLGYRDAGTGQQFYLPKQSRGTETSPLNFGQLLNLLKSTHGLDPLTAHGVLSKFLPGLPQPPNPIAVAGAKAAEIKRATSDVAGQQPLGVEQASKLYRYNPSTKNLETPPPHISSMDAEAGGYKILDKQFLNRLDEIAGVRPSLAALTVAVDQANRRSPIALELSKATGGLAKYVGAGEEGSLLDSTTRDFALQFDRLLGGVRGAASVQLFQAMRSRLPAILSTPEVRTRNIQIITGIVDVLEDNAMRRRFGMPPDETGMKNAMDAANVLINPNKQKAGAQTPNERVMVKTPDGKTGHIPRAQLEDALKAGYSQVQ